jgi:DNA-directed RNA polymerase subunit M/transcription elongation factor TFIIS
MSDSESVESDVETVTMSKSAKFHLVNNRVKKYENFTDQEWEEITEDISRSVPSEVVAIYYNRINNGGDSLWDNPNFESVLTQFNKESDIIKNPFPVSDCSEPCPKDGCGSMRTLVYEKQTRSADEPMTTYIFCGECGKTSRN